MQARWPEDIHHDIDLLRKLIDRELDVGRNGGLIVRAVSRVLQDKLRQLTELEQQHSFRVPGRELRWPDEAC